MTCNCQVITIDKLCWIGVGQGRSSADYAELVSRFLEDTFAEVSHLVHHSQPGNAHGLLNAFQALGLPHVQQDIAAKLLVSEKHSLR